MPQLDKFTYFSQFFWLCLFLFTFYVAICNDGDGVLGISRILKLRNQLLSHRENKIGSKDPDLFNALEDLSKKSLNTGLGYMQKTFFEVSQWCKLLSKDDFLGKITFLSSFGEISGSRGIERKILYCLARSSYHTSSSRKTCGNEIMLIHLLHGQGSIKCTGPLFD